MQQQHYQQQQQHSQHHHQQQQFTMAPLADARVCGSNNNIAVATICSNLLPMQPLPHNCVLATTSNTAAAATCRPAATDLHFSNRNKLTKLQWWHTPTTATAVAAAIIAPVAPPVATTALCSSPNSSIAAGASQSDHSAPTTTTTAQVLPPNATNVIGATAATSNQQSHQLYSEQTPNSGNHKKTTTTTNLSFRSRKRQLQQEAQSPVEFEDRDTTENFTQTSQLLMKDPNQCVGLLNADEEDEMLVTGYRRSRLRTALCWLCICLTAGLLRLVLHWWRHWYLIATHVTCPLNEADKVLVQEDYQGKHKIFYVKCIHNLNAAALSRQQEHKADNKNFGSTDTAPYNDVDFVCIQQQQDQPDERNFYFSVHFSSAQFKSSKSMRIFICKQLRYVWDIQTNSFRKIKGLDVNVSSAYFHQQRGMTTPEQLSRRLVYGPNEITVPYKDVKTLLFLEVLNPFYVFQIFSVVLWFAYNYYYYACVIVLMSVFGITMTIVQTKKNQDALRETVRNTGCALVVSNRGEVNEVPTNYLVPGDIIEIPKSGCTMQCDAVLLSGNCILDESMLTGESVPVTKTSLPMKRDVVFDKKEHARHTLFCGTKVIQTRYIGSEKVLAIVINTGNITAKGGLIRSILYPPPVDYKFEQDSYKFIACLALIALVGFFYTLISKILRDIDPVKIAVESLDLITIVVPPALPAAMTVGRYYAQKRLEQKSIYCISPRSINVAGSIDCCCFDKTGTLTEDGLDMWGVVPKSATNQFQIPIKQIERLHCDNFLFGMVTCHSITVMNGKMMGDPLDLKMFESTGWTLEDQTDIPDSQKYGLIHPTIVRQPRTALSPTASQPSTDFLTTEQRQSSVDDLLANIGLLNGESNNDHGIVREFPFSSHLQRMAVITRRLSEQNFNVYCKGSPEMLQQLCVPTSLPENYTQQLAIYAKQGYRIIAMAFKPLARKINYTKAQRLSRDAVESDLVFLGFVIMENRLKPDTSDVIRSLSAANIRTIMVTGDNILTALSVARDCGIVSVAQAVVTVHVRLRYDLPEPQQQRAHNYELYYTLELGSQEDALPPNGSDPKREHRRLVNGDLTSLSNSLHNSSSLSSVLTCDTWTHQEVLDKDVELGSGNMQQKQPDGVGLPQWRHNYCFAMDGNTWQTVRDHFPERLNYFITRGSIFARMSPEQKQALIMELQSLNYCVAMCGDGANDCGALKVAHTGISLSETESSIASPFTSRNSTIACVPSVIKEGRAALVTSFGIFKYMAAYSMVQFISVMILYSIDSNLTDKQYLYIDLGLISVFAFFFGKTEAYAGQLVRQVPLSSLISLTPLASIILHLLVVVCFQVAGWFQLHRQPWFVPFQLSDEEHLGCFENYTMFAISSFQYIALAFVFSKGAPYRKPIWSNMPFCLSLLINLAIVVYLTVYPADWLAKFFQLILPPVMDFRYWMLVYGALNFVTHLLVEMCLVELLLFRCFQVRRDQNPRISKRQYMHVEYELQYSCPTWPQITEVCEAYDASGSQRYDDEDAKMPTYVEISAEQTLERTIPPDNALHSFFEVADTQPSFPQ